MTVHDSSRSFRTVQDRSGQFRTVQDSSGQIIAIRDSSGKFGTVQETVKKGNSGQFRIDQDSSGQLRKILHCSTQLRTTHDNSGQFRTDQDSSRQFSTNWDLALHWEARWIKPKKHRSASVKINSFFSYISNVNPKDSGEYWDFDLEKMSLNDLPVVFKKIEEESPTGKVNVICHTTGCSQIAILMSEKPEFQDKIETIHMLSPIIALPTSSLFNLSRKLLPGTNIKHTITQSSNCYGQHYKWLWRFSCVSCVPCFLNMVPNAKKIYPCD